MSDDDFEKYLKEFILDEENKEENIKDKNIKDENIKDDDEIKLDIANLKEFTEEELLNIQNSENIQDFENFKEEDLDNLAEIPEQIIEEGAGRRIFDALPGFGMARPEDIEEDFFTSMNSLSSSDKLSNLSKITRTPENIFNIKVFSMKNLYNINIETIYDSLRIMSKIKQNGKILKYYNPKIIVCALLILEFKPKKNKIKILKNKIENINYILKSERINIIDVLKYCDFIKNLYL